MFILSSSVEFLFELERYTKFKITNSIVETCGTFRVKLNEHTNILLNLAGRAFGEYNIGWIFSGVF